MIGNYDDETNFPHELLLTNRQVADLRNAFANNSATDIKLSKTQWFQMINPGPLLKTGLPLINNVIKPCWAEYGSKDLQFNNGKGIIRVCYGSKLDF